jgi:ATP-binding cassette subfamily C protein CydC
MASVSRPAAATVLLAAVVVAALALGRRGRGGDRRAVATHRASARSQLITSIDTWEEMYCLGALSQLRASTTTALDSLREAEHEVAREELRARFLIQCASGAGTLAILLACVLPGRPPTLPDSTMLVVLGSGILELLTTLPAARRAGAEAAGAARRIAALGPPRPVDPRAGVLSDGQFPRADVEDDDGPPPIRLAGLRLRSTSSDRARLVDIELAGGSMLLVSGRSGSGKTTLLRTLAGELDPAGSVLVGRRSPRDHPPGDIVFVGHDDYLFTGTVADNLLMADPAISVQRMDALLAAMDLGRRGIDADTRLGVDGRRVSGGEHARLCLARAIARTPRALLLDEPTEGLDAATALLVLTQLRRLLPDTTVVAAIHDRDLERVSGLTALPGVRLWSLDAAVERAG